MKVWHFRSAMAKICGYILAFFQHKMHISRFSCGFDLREGWLPPWIKNLHLHAEEKRHMTRWHECTDPVSSRICTMALLKPQRGVCGSPFMNSITGLLVVSFFSLQAVPSPTHYTLYTSSPQPIHSTQAIITTPLYLGNHHHNQSTTPRQSSQLIHYT